MTDDMETKPTIETLLKRLAEFRESVDARLGSIESRLTSVDKKLMELGADIASFRSDADKNLRSIDRKMEI